MKNSRINSLRGREILDCRGEPTVEVEVVTDFGCFLASVPSGASKGKYEAVELRDEVKRHRGKGVLKSVNNINKIISPKLRGKDPAKQKEIDDFLIKLDGTKNKSKLGANAILGVSMAICRAGAAAKKLPLYQYIKKIFNFQPAPYRPASSQRGGAGAGFSIFNFPTPCFNVINGGLHAGNNLDFQEFMIVPQFKEFSKNLEVGIEIYHKLKETLREDFGKSAINIGDEGGFTPPINSPERVLDLLQKIINFTGYKKNVKLALDCAASQFFQNDSYKLKGEKFSSEDLLIYYQNLLKKYPILFLEDPFSEDDWQGWQKLNQKLKIKNQKLLIVGDDLLATNPERMKMAKEKSACNAVIIKPNQIGTITETISAVKLAKFYKWKIIVSHRSGETNDDFISDLAVGVGADFIKAGAPARGERVAKYNRLLKIEEDLCQN